MDEVRHSELLPLDEIGRAAIVAAITKETATLTQATNGTVYDTRKDTVTTPAAPTPGV